jgi:MFS family permease
VADPLAVRAAPANWDRGLWALLFVLSGNMVLDSIEVSVVLLALPAIGTDLDLSLWTVQWLMSGFAFGFAALLLFGPALTARWGQRRTYLGAMLLFAIASLAGGFADGEVVLIVSRVVKGFCAALTAPAGLAVISTVFPDGPQQRKAVTIYSLFGAVGFTAGLLLSGLLSGVDWRWTFLFPAPVAVVLLLFGIRTIPSVPSPSRPRLSAALLRDVSLRRSTAGAALLNGAYIGLLLVVTIRLAGPEGWTPWQTALALLPACVPLAVTVPFAGRFVPRFGTARLIATGTALVFAGTVLFLSSAGTGSYLSGVLPTLLLVEAGFVLCFTALHMQATATVEPGLRRLAVPVYQTGVQLGAGLALPLTAALLTGTASHRPAALALTVVAAAGFAVALAGVRTRRTSEGEARS